MVPFVCGVSMSVQHSEFQNTVLYTHPKSAKNDAQTKYYEVQWTEIDLETGLMKQSKEPRESIFTDTSGCRFIKSFWQSKNVAYRGGVADP